MQMIGVKRSGGNTQNEQMEWEISEEIQENKETSSVLRAIFKGETKEEAKKEEPSETKNEKPKETAQVSHENENMKNLMVLFVFMLLLALFWFGLKLL